MALSEETRRTAFLSLAGVAVVALLTAILVTVLAVDGAGLWIVAALVVVVLVIIAEIMLLILGRPKPVAEETYEFVIEAEQ